MRSPRPFDFMHWAKGPLETAEYPLGGSGTRSPSPQEWPAPRSLDPRVASSLGDEGGMPDLRAAVAAQYGLTVNEVLISDGASLANYTALTALAGAGDRVMVETPAYPALAEIPRFHGATVLPWSRRAEDGWQPRLEDLGQALREGPLAAVVLTRLHNPTGADLPPSFLEELATLAERHDFVVLLDEVYLDFLPEATPGFRFSPRFVCTGSLTKVQGFGGLRVGWILGQREWLQPMHELSYYLSVNSSAPSQALAVGILAESDRWLQRALRLAAEGRAVFDEWMAARSDVSCVAPAGGLNAFVKLERIADPTSFVDQLLRDRGVAVADGGFFGAPGWMRISFSPPPAVLRAGLQHLGEALDEAGG